MSMEVPDEIRERLRKELEKIERTTDLRNLTVLSRAGMRIATSSSSSIDADPITASSAALIDLGLRFVNNLNHGRLREIILRGKYGYAILMYIDSNFMMFAGLSNPGRIGYYLEYLRIKCKLFSYILAGGKITEELKSEIEADKKKSEEESKSLGEIFESDKSSEADMNAMQEVLNFLEEWGGDDIAGDTPETTGGIVGIDEEILLTARAMHEEEGAEAGESAATVESPQVKEKVPEFPVYDDEVPPVPLEEYELPEYVNEYTTYKEYRTGEEGGSATSEEAGVVGETVPPPPDQGIFIPDEEPDFDKFIATEYVEDDWDISEEAMLEALSDLGYIKKDDKNKE